MTKSKTVEPDTTTTIQTTIRLHPEVAAYALWLSLNQPGYTPGRSRRCCIAAHLELHFRAGRRRRGVEPWRPPGGCGLDSGADRLNKRERDMVRRAMMQRLAAIQRRNAVQRDGAKAHADIKDRLSVH